eukprot:gene10139-13639_t
MYKLAVVLFFIIIHVTTAYLKGGISNNDALNNTTQNIWNKLQLWCFPSNSSRSLSATVDLITSESIKTVDGVIPEVSCPLGTYRPTGSTVLVRVSGQRQDGCKPCPRGRYGDKSGLLSVKCSGSCPPGTYSDVVGLKSISDCKKCAPGKYGVKTGLTSDKCTANCPNGKYSDTEGNIALSSCKDCPPNYFHWQCVKL